MFDVLLSAKVYVNKLSSDISGGREGMECVDEVLVFVLFSESIFHVAGFEYTFTFFIC